MSQSVTAVGSAGAGRARRLDIQGMRAIAVIVVVAFHSGLPIPGGFVGVDMFFVISGFVITAMLQAEWGATGRINFGRFYARRFRRLIPALAVLVMVTMAISAFVLSPFGTQQTAAKTAIGAMFFAANAVIARTTGGYFDAPAETNPLLNIWSLSVEEQFYLAFPAVLAIGWLLSGRIRFYPILIVGCIAAASFALAEFGSAHPRASWLLGFYSPFTRAWEFAFGALLGLSATRYTIASRSLATIVGLLGVLLVIAALWFINRTTPFPGVSTLLPIGGTAFLILAGTHQSNIVTRLLAVIPLVKIGDWSYSIYLWHWPFTVFATLMWPGNWLVLMVALSMSVLAALASYKWVEQPIRNAHGLSIPRFATLATITLALPILFAFGSWQAPRNFFFNRSVAALIAETTLPTGWQNPLCVSRIAVNKRDTAQCQWGTDAPGKPIYLVGDSNAMHFSEAARHAGLALQRPVTALGIDGCPMVDAFLWRKSDPPLMAECHEDYIAMMDWLTKKPPGLVMIGSVDRYWRDTEDYRVSVDGIGLDDDPKLNADKLNSGLQRTVERLQKAGHRVVLLQTIPHHTVRPYTIAENCTGWDVINRRCKVVSEMPLEFADQQQAVSRQGIMDVAARTGAAVFDFRDYFCSKGQCSTKINGVDHYMPDGYHLNKSGSVQLTETLIRAIKWQ